MRNLPANDIRDALGFKQTTFSQIDAFWKPQALEGANTIKAWMKNPDDPKYAQVGRITRNKLRQEVHADQQGKLFKAEGGGMKGKRRASRSDSESPSTGSGFGSDNLDDDSGSRRRKRHAGEDHLESKGVRRGSSGRRDDFSRASPSKRR